MRVRHSTNYTPQRTINVPNCSSLNPFLPGHQKILKNSSLHQEYYSTMKTYCVIGRLIGYEMVNQDRSLML
jgi:hypothetical protein